MISKTYSLIIRTTVLMNKTLTKVLFIITVVSLRGGFDLPSVVALRHIYIQIKSTYSPGTTTIHVMTFLKNTTGFFTDISTVPKKRGNLFPKLWTPIIISILWTFIMVTNHIIKFLAKRWHSGVVQLTVTRSQFHHELHNSQNISERSNKIVMSI